MRGRFLRRFHWVGIQLSVWAVGCRRVRAEFRYSVQCFLLRWFVPVQAYLVVFGWFCGICLLFVWVFVFCCVPLGRVVVVWNFRVVDWCRSVCVYCYEIVCPAYIIFNVNFYGFSSGSAVGAGNSFCLRVGYRASVFIWDCDIVYLSVTCFYSICPIDKVFYIPFVGQKKVFVMKMLLL